MPATTLARAARRLGGVSMRGLGDALCDTQAASTSSRHLQASQQPWMVTAWRALGSGSGSGSAEASPSSSGGVAVPTPPQLSLAVEDAMQASGSRRAATEAEAAAAAAAAATARPPPGHTDFTQRQLLMLFTCSKCNTRAAKAFSKQAYEQGVVIVDCPGCESKHLIADNLGWFGQKGTVEHFAAERGSTVMRRTADGTVELTPEELMGASLVNEAQAVAAAASGGGTTPS